MAIKGETRGAFFIQIYAPAECPNPHIAISVSANGVYRVAVKAVIINLIILINVDLAGDFV